MIRRNGKKDWNNIHVTVKQTVEDLIDIDNSNPEGLSLSRVEILNQASGSINEMIKEAVLKKKGIRAIGSSWALSHIQVTENWLLNTKLLNECFEVDPEWFHDDYPEDKKKLLVIAQCGISIGELNVYLELPKSKDQMRRCLKTAGIGAGQTIVGAVSGNTHGAAVNFGALPEFVVAIQLCNGTDKPIWIERNTYPVMRQEFIDTINSKLVMDEDIFNSVLVSFGAFGVITAFAIETDNIFHINFPKVKEINQSDLGSLLTDPSYYSKLQHLEFVFNPYEDDHFYLIEGTRVAYEEGLPDPKPLWIITNKTGYAVGDKLTKFLLNLFFISGKKKSNILLGEYLKNAVLTGVRGTPGQLYTATVTYLEGYNETAFAVSTDDAIKIIQIVKQATKDKNLPLVFQARIVKPGSATFGFTNHSPRAVVFEFGIVNTSKYPEFESLLLNKFREENIHYSLHWSKNSLVDSSRLEEMYGPSNVLIWKKSRYALFNNQSEIMDIFNNEHLKIAGLDTPP
ncbi:MAG: hypothetical protein ABI707_04055 [Ferruginibacter sp.]